VNCVAFYEEDFLLTAGTDNLKAWDVRGEVVLTDNVESGSKGVLGMALSDRIQQLAFSGGTLSYHQCFLHDVSFKGPYAFSNHSISYEKPERTEEAIDRNNSIRRGNSNNPIAHITSEKTKSMLSKRHDSFAKQLSDVTDNVNDALSNIKRASEEFSKRRNDSLELKEMMGEEHSKFLKIMSQRAKAIQGMLDLWMKGNLKVLIQTLKSYLLLT
jgi:flagellar hook-basal body complex protein FliE